MAMHRGRSLFVCLSLFCGLWVPPAIAQVARTARELAPQLYTLDEKVVDYHVPQIVMEQIHSARTRLPGYRLQIFRDGRVIYHGLKSVKTVGEVQYQLSPAQVRKIEEEFLRLKFWQVPEHQYGVPYPHGALTLRFTLRNGLQERTVRFDGQSHGVMLQHVIESEVGSARWRCPFEDIETGRELCQVQNRFIEEGVAVFLKNDLPRLMEEYK